MEPSQLKAILEAIFFMAPEPISVNELKKVLNLGPPSPCGMELEGGGTEEDNVLAQLQARQEQLEGEVSVLEIKEAISQIQADYQNNPSKGFELVSVAKGYQFRTKEAMGPYLKKLYKLPKPRLSSPSMETLAIIAYKQPINRAKIEEVRGVDSGGVLKTLLERDLIRIIGRSEEPGRPILYGTTKAFLETFTLQSLSDLPSLQELASLEGEKGSSNVEEDSESSQTDEEVAQASGDEDSGEILDDESGELINELENSIRHLKDVEKNVFGTSDKEEENKILE